MFVQVQEMRAIAAAANGSESLTLNCLLNGLLGGQSYIVTVATVNEVSSKSISKEDSTSHN